jgi:hypothetical protein
MSFLPPVMILMITLAGNLMIKGILHIILYRMGGFSPIVFRESDMYTA